jgi:photosystem II stability/assembly factor-like uncharacterized protein
MKIYILTFLLLFLMSCDNRVSEFLGSGSAEGTKIIFRSNDGGQTWVDISEGLPENLADNFARDGFSVNDNGIYLRIGDGIYHNTPNSTGPFWSKEDLTGRQKKDVRNWLESNGALLTTTRKGIMRSADGGKTWDLAIGEGGVITLEKINGGVAAITYNKVSKTRRVRTSYDGGKTWEAIDAGLPPSPFIASIIQVGEYFFCGHPSGVFRSSDNGKTWTLVLPSVGEKVFRFSASGHVIYASPRLGGC